MKKKHKLLSASIFALLTIVSQNIFAGDNIPWEGHDLWNETSLYFIYGKVKPVTNENTVFLYNVQAGKEKGNVNCYFNSFGHWGVEGTLFEVGMPLYLKSLQNIKTGGDKKCIKTWIYTNPDERIHVNNKVAWLWGMGNNDNNGVITDRVQEDETKKQGSITWYFKPIEKTKRYNIFVYNKNGKRAFLGRIWGQQRKNDLRKYTLICDEIDPNKAKNDENYQWIVVTRKDIIKQFNNDALTKIVDYFHPLNATFYLKEQNFSRVPMYTQQGEIHKKPGMSYSNWKTEGNVIIANNRGSLNYENPNTDYTVTQKEYDDFISNDTPGSSAYYNALYGAFYTGNINGANGHIWQETEPMDVNGYYEVTIQGFYKKNGNKKGNAYLYAEANNPDRPSEKQFVSNPLLPIDALPEGKRPTDKTSAGICYWSNFQNYSCKVIIRVNQGQRIKVGIKHEGGNDNDWVSFDNMQLKYVGTPYLISENYGSINTYDPEVKIFKPLVLERTVLANKWNSITLPLDLNKDQVCTAFGNDVKLAELDNLDIQKGQTIVFKSINLISKPWNEVVIQKNKPYLILPSKEGRRYHIVWDFKLDGKHWVETDGPNFIIPMTHFNKNDVKEEPIKKYDRNGKSLTIHPNLWYHTKKAGATYGQIQASKNNYIYVMHKGKLRRLTQPFDLLGLRFYIDYTEAVSAGYANPMLSIIGEGNNSETDNIQVIHDSSNNNYINKQKAVYSISGQKLSNGIDVKSLPAGMYIVDGKKVMVY